MSFLRPRLIFQLQIEPLLEFYVLILFVQRILVEGPSKRDASELQGRTENNRVVNFKVGPDGSRLVGQLIDVAITSTSQFSLRGDVVVRV